MSTQQDKTNELNAVKTLMAEFLTITTTQQAAAHNVILAASIYAFKHNDCSVIDYVLNSMTSVRGSFRVESVAYWLKHIAGLPSLFSEKTEKWQTKMNKHGDYASDHGVEFTYDPKHVVTLKLEKFRFWVIAPKQNMNLKLNVELEKITNSAEIMIARAVAAGKLTDVEISLHVANMLKRIKDFAATGKTQEWLDAYYLQHPDQKPTGRNIEEVEKAVQWEEVESITG